MLFLPDGFTCPGRRTDRCLLDRGLHPDIPGLPNATCLLLLTGPLRLQLCYPLSGPRTIHRAPVEIHLGCHLFAISAIYITHH